MMIKESKKSNIKPGYKKTSIGIIPEDWEEMRLEQVSKIIMGVSPNSENYNFEGQGKFLIQGNADIRNRKSAPRQYTSEITKECQVGDILMSVRAPVGEIAKSIHNACIGRGVCAIRNNKKADGEFLFYYLLNTEVLWSRFKQGSTFESVNSTDIRNFTIQIPPIQEQKAIADCLSTWDKGIEKLSALIASKKEQKKGLMQQLLTGKKRLDGFTEEWEEVKLEDLAEYRRGSFPQPYGLAKWYDDNGMPFIQVYDVDDNFKLKEDTKRKISDLAAEKSIFVPKGTLIITIQGSIGRLAITDYDAYMDRTLLLFTRFKKQVNKYFIMYQLYRLFQIEKERAPGGTIKTITIRVLSKFTINITSIEEQNTIAGILNIADKEIELLEKKLEAFKIQKKGLMQVLLTGTKRLV